jgi:hypothetical protein
MANVSQGFTGYITLADNGNERSTKSYQLRGITYAAAMVALTVWSKHWGLSPTQH